LSCMSWCACVWPCAWARIFDRRHLPGKLKQEVVRRATHRSAGGAGDSRDAGVKNQSFLQARLRWTALRTWGADEACLMKL